MSAKCVCLWMKKRDSMDDGGCRLPDCVMVPGGALDAALAEVAQLRARDRQWEKSFGLVVAVAAGHTIVGHPEPVFPLNNIPAAWREWAGAPEPLDTETP